MNAKVEVRNINPSEASFLLDNLFEGQRSRRLGHTQKMIRDMKEGRWVLNPDAILLVKGKLANGQHRMAALMEAKMTLPFIVMESKDDQLYKVLDSGIKRTAADVIGGRYEKVLASIARIVCHYDKGALYLKGTGREGSVTRSDIVDYAMDNREALEAHAAIVSKLYDQKRIISCAQGGFLLHIFSRKNPEQAKAFIEAVYLGHSRDDAAFDFRERLIKNSASTSKLKFTYLLALGFKSFKSYLKGTRPGVLKMAEGESFPTLD